MFIRVKYGDDATLLCNPNCVVINLLSSIRTRSGRHVDTETVIDLADETGHVQLLDSHLYDCAAKLLSVPGTYVLVKREATSPGLDNDDEAADNAFEYVPLLNNCHQLLPGYRIQRAAGGGPADAAVSRKGKGDGRRKSQSPTGAKTTRSRQAKDRASSRKLGDKK